MGGQWREVHIFCPFVQPDRRVEVDVLSEVLTTVHLQGALQFCPTLSAPWGIRVDAQPQRAFFYSLVRGSCYLEIDGSEMPLPLAAGDVVMLAQGTGHTLRDCLQSPTIALEEMARNGCSSQGLKTLQWDGSGDTTALVSGAFKFENRRTSHFLSILPPLLYISAEDGHNVPGLKNTLQLLVDESAPKTPGTEIIRARLTDVLFVQILRAFIAQVTKLSQNCKGSARLLRAFVDPQISRALTLIHQQPQRRWTLTELAKQLGMSRTSFAVRFSQVAGITPLDYVRKWRIHRACDLLQQAEHSLDEIAERVGYESGAAFSKAFKREMGITPGLYRRKQSGFAA
jgi:AraC-like DNA-binding protein